MAPKRANGPAEGQADQSKNPEASPKAPRSQTGGSTRARRKGRPGKDPKKVERARLALQLNGGNAQQAAKVTGIPRTTIQRWIADGEFDQDAWDKVRDQKKREAIELAYEGLSAQLEELKVPHHKTVTRPDGTVIDEGPSLSPQAVRAQVEVIRVLGGGPAKAADEGGDQRVQIEFVPPSWPEYDASGKVVPFRRPVSA